MIDYDKMNEDGVNPELGTSSEDEIGTEDEEELTWDDYGTGNLVNSGETFFDDLMVDEILRMIQDEDDDSETFSDGHLNYDTYTLSDLTADCNTKDAFNDNSKTNGITTISSDASTAADEEEELNHMTDRP